MDKSAKKKRLLDLPHYKDKDKWTKIKSNLEIMGDSKINFAIFLHHWNNIGSITKRDPRIDPLQLEFMKSQHHVNHFIANQALLSEFFYEEMGPFVSLTGEPYEAIFTKRDLAVLNALMFFGLFPNREDRNTFPINPSYCAFFKWKEHIEHLKCIYNYFDLLQKRTEKDSNYLEKMIIYKRNTIKSNDIFNEITKESLPLTEYNFNLNDPIEGLLNTIQIDFANQYIGGGVTIGCSCQEEIRFIICPEMLPSLLIFEKMDANDAIFIIGAEQFSKYKGYSKTFSFDGAHEDRTEFVEDIQLTVLSAIDAENYSKNHLVQFKEQSLMRELRKAYVGFKFDLDDIIIRNSDIIKFEEQLFSCTLTKTPSKTSLKILDNIRLMPIATGKWGCGVFKGNFALKFLIQVLAASWAKKKEIIFCLFNDDHLVNLSKTYLENFSKLNTNDLFEFLCLMIKDIEAEKIKNIESEEIFFRLKSYISNLKV